MLSARFHSLYVFVIIKSHYNQLLISKGNRTYTMAYFIVLLAAVMHALWNSMVKGSSDKLATIVSIRVVGLLFGLSLVAFVPPPSLTTVGYLVATTLLLYLYHYLLIRSYQRYDLSRYYPVSRGLAPLIVLFAGVVLLGEALPPAKLLAVILISLGVIALSCSPGKKESQALWYGVCTAFAIAGYTTLSGIGVHTTGSFLTFSVYLEIMTSAGVLAFFALKRRYNPIRSSVRSNRNGLIAGVISVVGYMAVIWAMTRIPVACVAALRETSIIFAALIGTIVFKEGSATMRISSASVVAAGVMLLVSQ